MLPDNDCDMIKKNCYNESFQFETMWPASPIPYCNTEMSHLSGAEKSKKSFSSQLYVQKRYFDSVISSRSSSAEIKHPRTINITDK